MANEIRKYKLSWLDIQNVINMVLSSSTIAGSLPRQGLLKRLRKLELAADEKEKPFKEIFREVSLNREELGAMKLTFIELWSAPNATGHLREAIEMAAVSLDIWREHVLKNLPKEPSVAIDSFDSDEDIMRGDSGEGVIEEAPVSLEAPGDPS